MREGDRLRWRERILFPQRSIKERKTVMKKNYTFKLRLNEEMARKLAYTSEKDGLSVQNMLVQLVRQRIQYFERLKGNVQKSDQNAADMSAFELEEQ